MKLPSDWIYELPAFHNNGKSDNQSQDKVIIWKIQISLQKIKAILNENMVKVFNIKMRCDS